MSTKRSIVCPCGSKHCTDSIARGDLSASTRRQARKYYLATKRAHKRADKRQAMSEGLADYLDACSAELEDSML